MMSGFLAVGYFLFTVLFSLITFILWIRIALRYYKISALHPMAQIIYRVSNPLVSPLNKLIKPNSRFPRFDLSCFIVLVLVEIIKFSLISLIFFNTLFYWTMIALYTVADLIVQPCNLLFYALIIRVIMSWINPQWNGPLAELIYLITEPLMRLARRVIPIISGIDFSPLVILVILQIITLFIRTSLPLHLI